MFVRFCQAQIFNSGAGSHGTHPERGIGFPGGSFSGQSGGPAPTPLATCAPAPTQKNRTTRDKTGPAPKPALRPPFPQRGKGAGGKEGEPHRDGSSNGKRSAQKCRAAVSTKRGTSQRDRPGKERACPPHRRPAHKRRREQPHDYNQRRAGGESTGRRPPKIEATRLDSGPGARGAARKDGGARGPARSRGREPGWNNGKTPKCAPCGVANKGRVPQRGCGASGPVGGEERGPGACGGAPDEPPAEGKAPQPGGTSQRRGTQESTGRTAQPKDGRLHAPTAARVACGQRRGLNGGR